MVVDRPDHISSGVCWLFMLNGIGGSHGAFEDEREIVYSDERGFVTCAKGGQLQNKCVTHLCFARALTAHSRVT